MVHNNKVLTVSYGTFSCTLEGFEDSFGTMKAIAEYFRDLASDDRYFGAEPPQPDAEMLARIAQREVARQVEARTSSDGIHLRTAAPAEAPSQPAIEPSPAVAPAVETAPNEAVVTPAAENSAEIWTDEKPQLTPLAEDSTEIHPSEVDLFLDDDNQPEPDSSGAEIASDAQVEVATAAHEAGPEEDQEKVEAPAPAATVDLATIAAISAAVSEAPAPVETAQEDSAAEDVEFFDEEVTADPLSPPRGNDTVPAADSIAAKLQRIRAVVSQTPDEEFSEDEHAEAFVETARAELAQVEEDEPADIGAETESDEITRVLNRLDLTGDLSATAPAPQDLSSDEEASASDLPESDASSSEVLIASVLQEPETDQGEAVDSAETNDAEEASAEAPARPRRRIRLNRQSAPETEAPDAIGDAARDVPAEAGETLAAEAAADQEQKATPDRAESAQPQTSKPLRARIVKVKRADLEQAMATGALEEVSEETDMAAPTVESSLDAEEEADLLRELAEVEAELLASNEDELEEADTQPEAPEETEVLKTAEQVSTSPAAPNTPNTQATSSPDSDVTRLMEAAESKLGDPDNATSRETYSQLRAAVAAAEADRSAGGNSVQTDEAEPYREDLASVVRPRRPGAAGAAKASRPRAAGSRPAPLKLVAEQRIDPETTAPAKPVRPRRISTPVEEAPAAQTEAFGSFAEYVQDQGAAELHELLEAAASYLSFVEGRDHFSRPQLMNKVRSVGHGDFNRENGLRSIGLLLREGKIERSDNGHFSATDDIGFRPPKRAAG
ncbi:chemotaxis protein CheA [Pseudophaeobacter sp. EL27]|uniref:chemotaxis protein CheA n=1 Tax=Pseudophaeobacter sp. EL27 TaxID=2107580 RepID=UPI000EFD2668|nr:chemotaxis protein CheA [Pseudophaeobacter sp. EL27]